MQGLGGWRRRPASPYLCPTGPAEIILPAIIGLAGPELTPDEAALLRDHPPAGVILFARNIVAPAQLAALTASLRGVLPRGALLMVDQEGGRVARLRPPHWLGHPPARAVGDLYARNPQAGRRAAWITGALIGQQCRAAGFDLVAAPVLDVAAPDGHDVIGDRAFSADPAAVAALGGATARGILAAGAQPVGKHAPGHGRARADSHLELPTLDGVTEADLAPFRANVWLPWLMTAHIRYTAQDMHNPATLSPTLTAMIRGLGFHGVLVSDDLAMHALTGTPAARAARALRAGCDVALHCSGVFAETADLLGALSSMPHASASRLAAGAALAGGTAMPLDAEALATERATLLAC